MRGWSLTMTVLVAAFGGLVLALLVLSLPWPLIHDAAVMHYIAWRIGEGDVPYRDLYDINQPAVYVIHLALLRTLGAGDAAWRAFDIAWLAATTAVLGVFAAPWGGRAAVGAAFAFAAYHLAGGAWQAGQRDFLVCLFAVLFALGVARWLEGGRTSSLVWAGVALGAAISVKPYAALYGVALGVLVLAAATRSSGPGGAISAGAALVAGVAAVPAALAMWLAKLGGLGAWYDIVSGYAIPVYGHAVRSSVWLGYRWIGWIPLGMGALVSVGVALVDRRLGPRHLVAALGVGYGLVHYVAQGQGHEYHLYPLAAFACVLAFSALAPHLATRHAAAGVSLTVSLTALFLLLAVKGVPTAETAWIWDKERRVRMLTQALHSRLAPGDTVQVLDVADGGLHALLRLGVRQPTRFLYDVFFFHETDRPVVRAMRAEFVGALERTPPRFVVVMGLWPASDYDRVRKFPALADVLAARYEVVETRDGFRLYARRA
jgi:hypothetical protein